MHLCNFRYMKEINQKTNIKPPDLWIHHDQMELKALEKSSVNGEASTSGGGTSNTLPRSGNQDYEPDNVHMNSSSLDKRTYMPSYMGNAYFLVLRFPSINTPRSQKRMKNDTLLHRRFFYHFLIYVLISALQKNKTKRIFVEKN